MRLRLPLKDNDLNLTDFGDPVFLTHDMQLRCSYVGDGRKNTPWSHQTGMYHWPSRVFTGEEKSNRRIKVNNFVKRSSIICQELSFYFKHYEEKRRPSLQDRITFWKSQPPKFIEALLIVGRLNKLMEAKQMSSSFYLNSSGYFINCETRFGMC